VYFYFDITSSQNFHKLLFKIFPSGKKKKKKNYPLSPGYEILPKTETLLSDKPN
jgi:hypothetical protein